MEQKKKKKNNKGKYILIGLVVLALVGGGTFLFFKQRKEKQQALADNLFDPQPPTLPSIPTQTTSSSTTVSNAKFPLKRGSSGQLVKNIQKALIAKFGRKILPKYGADGHWGSEMQSALKKLKLPTTITSQMFNQILTSGALQLTGFDSEQLQTTTKTTIWNRKGKKLTVPAHTILGEFVDAKNGVTQFRTLDNQLLFIHTKNISYV